MSNRVLLVAECREGQGSPIRVYEDGKIGIYNHAGHELRLATAADIPADLATEALGLSTQDLGQPEAAYLRTLAAEDVLIPLSGEPFQVQIGEDEPQQRVYGCPPGWRLKRGEFLRNGEDWPQSEANQVDLIDLCQGPEAEGGEWLAQRWRGSEFAILEVRESFAAAFQAALEGEARDE